MLQVRARDFAPLTLAREHPHQERQAVGMGLRRDDVEGHRRLGADQVADGEVRPAVRQSQLIGEFVSACPVVHPAGVVLAASHTSKHHRAGAAALRQIDENPIRVKAGVTRYGWSAGVPAQVIVGLFETEAAGDQLEQPQTFVSEDLLAGCVLSDGVGKQGQDQRFISTLAQAQLARLLKSLSRVSHNLFAEMTDQEREGRIFGRRPTFVVQRLDGRRKSGQHQLRRGKACPVERDIVA